MMSVRRALASVGILAIANGVNAVFAFGVSVVAARALAPSEFGRIAVLMVTSTFLTIILDLGINQILTRRVAVRPLSRLVGDVHRVRLLLAFAASGGALLYFGVGAIWPAPWFSPDAGAWVLLVLASVWQLVFCTEQAYVQGLQRFGTLAFQIVAINLARLGFVGIAAALHSSFLGVLLGYTLPAVAVGIVSGYRLRRSSGRILRWRLLGALVPVIGLAGVVVSITALLTRMSMWLVAFLAGHGTAGWYAVAFQAASLVLALGSAVTLCILPYVVQADRKRTAHAFLIAYLRRASVAVALLSAGAGVFAYLVPRLFGPRYAGIEAVTWLLMMAFLISLVNGPFYAWQQARLRYAFLVKVHSTQVLLLAIVCFFLVPRWGGRGAAVAELVTRATGVAWVIVDALVRSRPEHGETTVRNAQTQTAVSGTSAMNTPGVGE